MHYTPLFHAVLERRSDVVSTLIEAGAEVDAIDKVNFTLYAQTQKEEYYVYHDTAGLTRSRIRDIQRTYYYTFHVWTTGSAPYDNTDTLTTINISRMERPLLTLRLKAV
jgi:ankyrin repeat protein